MSLVLTREVNLATHSSAISAEEIRESERAFQSLIEMLSAYVSEIMSGGAVGYAFLF